MAHRKSKCSPAQAPLWAHPLYRPKKSQAALGILEKWAHFLMGGSGLESGVSLSLSALQVTAVYSQECFSSWGCLKKGSLTIDKACLQMLHLIFMTILGSPHPPPIISFTDGTTET